MHSNDDSWIITTEVEVAFDWKVEAYHDPLWVRVVAIPDEHWMDRSFDNVRAEGSGSPLQVYWDKRKLNVQLYATHVEADNL